MAREVTIYDDGDEICDNFGNYDENNKTCKDCFIKDNCSDETTLREALRRFDDR